jgi:hypothetical protein
MDTLAWSDRAAGIARDNVSQGKKPCDYNDAVTLKYFGLKDEKING